MKKFKRLKVTNIKKLNEHDISFNLEEEEVTTAQIFEEHEKVISDLVDKGVLRLEDNERLRKTTKES